jgi:hypothetical protein
MVVCSLRRSATAVAIGAVITGLVAGCNINGNAVTRVGNGISDAHPGVYTTLTNNQALCTFIRRSSTNVFDNSKMLGIVSATGGGRAFMQVLPSDVVIESQNCPTWEPVAATSYNRDRTRATPGEYRVGADLEPGTYSTPQPAQLCQWFRLRNWLGVTNPKSSQNSVIAEGGSVTETSVTIKATDIGFQSYGCGTWTRIGP